MQQPQGYDSYGTGRRKRAIARVFLKGKGTGAIMVNGLDITKYFKRETSQRVASQPLRAVEMEKNIDLTITVKGGGESGQAGAVRHGIARAIAALKPELKSTLRAATPDLIRRDPRKVERKKVALRGARRAPQYSKR